MSLPRRPAPWSPSAQALLAGVVSFAVFALLRSRDYGAVDGAVRCLEIFHRQEVLFHGNNHMLYPLNVFVWHRLLALLGVAASTPFEYLAHTQLMNALAAAVCVAAVYRLAHLAGGSWRIALGAAVLYASSRALLVHATNSAEPVVGLCWSLLAVLALALGVARPRPSGGAWHAAAAGVLFALAMAAYQSMVLLGAAALVLCLAPGGRRERVWRILALAAGSLCGAVLIYGLAYEAMGIEGIAAKIQSFFAIGGGPETFGRPSLRKVVLAPLGFAENLVDILADDVPGFRSLLRSPLALVTVAAGLLLLAVTLLGLARLRAAWPGLDGRLRLAFAAGLAGLAATLAPPVVWDPFYDKLWLQPLACWSLLAALAVGRLPWPRVHPARAAAAVPLLVLALNLAWAVPEHRRETPYLAEARRVAEIAAERDLVVHEWDGISVLYGTIWGWSRERHRFDFPTAALHRGPAVRQDLDRAVDAAFARGGRVWFVGILDAPRAHWDVFLGAKAGLPWESLAPYRAGARAVESFSYRGGRLPLYLWEGPAPRPGGAPAEDRP